MRRILPWLFLLFITSACNHIPTSTEIHNVTRISVNNSVPETYITGDSLHYDVLYPTDICVIDTFLLIAQHKDKNLIHVYSLKDTTLLGKFLQQGGGPDEVGMWNGFTQCWKEKGEVKVLIQSYQQKIAILNLNHSLKAQKCIFEKSFSFQNDSARKIMQNANTTYRINGDFLITRSLNQMEKGTKNYNPSFQWFDIENDEPGDIIYAMDLKTTDNPFLYVPGAMTLRPSGDKLCYACRFLNTFAILDITNQAALQVFFDPKDLDIESIVDKHQNSIYYSAAASTDNNLFLATSKGKERDQANTIDMYDWQGKYIHRFITNDVIHHIAVDETGHYLYAVLNNGSMKRYSLKYE